MTINNFLCWPTYRLGLNLQGSSVNPFCPFLVDDYQLPVDEMRLLFIYVISSRFGCKIVSALKGFQLAKQTVLTTFNVVGYRMSVLSLTKLRILFSGCHSHLSHFRENDSYPTLCVWEWANSIPNQSFLYSDSCGKTSAASLRILVSFFFFCLPNPYPKTKLPPY